MILSTANNNHGRFIDLGSSVQQNPDHLDTASLNSVVQGTSTLRMCNLFF
jgi:hypothetical protein